MSFLKKLLRREPEEEDELDAIPEDWTPGGRFSEEAAPENPEKIEEEEVEQPVEVKKMLDKYQNKLQEKRKLVNRIPQPDFFPNSPTRRKVKRWFVAILLIAHLVLGAGLFRRFAAGTGFLLINSLIFLDYLVVTKDKTRRIYRDDDIYTE